MRTISNVILAFSVDIDLGHAMGSSHRFFQFDGVGETYYADGKVERRWHVDKNLALHRLQMTRYRNVGRIDPWDPGFSVECWSKDPIEDMPWVDGSFRSIVSDRMKVWLEKHAPQHAQFLPVRMTLRKKILKLPPYWVANWLKEIDCHDPERTEWYPGRGSAVEPEIAVLTVDPRRVPSAARIFKCKYIPCTVLIRGDIKILLETSGMTGPHYSSVRHRDDPWPPPEEAQWR